MDNYEFFDAYIADMNEHLELLNEALLKMDKNYNDKNIINDIFRSFHTMKGSTAAMGFVQSAEIIHCMEDLLQGIRDDRIIVDGELVQFLFTCHDFVEEIVHTISSTESEEGFNQEFLMKELVRYISLNSSDNHSEQKSADICGSSGKCILSPEELECIRSKISEGYKAYLVNMIIAEDCQFKAVRAWMAFEAIEQEAEIIKSAPVKPDAENFSNNSAAFNERGIQAIVISAKECEELYHELDAALMEMEQLKIEEYILEETARQADIDRIIEGNTSTHKELVEYVDSTTSQDVEKLILPQGKKAEVKREASFIRIPEQKVDSLVRMLGELLIIQSLNKQEIMDQMTALNLQNSGFINNITRMERITKEIQTLSMSLRMVSLKQSFQKLLRIGRDTAIDLKKEISIELFGDDTEIDRSAVEKIQDPLMHLVRNAISHGIEDSEERVAKGKSAQGRVCIRAYNKRGYIIIEVEDDGKGLWPEKIYEKAKEKQLINLSKNYSEDEVIHFIFMPGFSTQENINNISGRGVGMNVVETEIIKMGGKVEIDNSPGNGCKFILKIPVNMATINGTIVELCQGRYILPTLSIKQIIKPDLAQWVNIGGKTAAVKVRNEIIQLISINRILGIDSKINYKESLIIVIELEGNLRALPANRVLGKQEIVVKPLELEFCGLDYAAGATILGDGKVSVILDIEALFSKVS